MTLETISKDGLIRQQRTLLDEADRFLVGIESDPRSFGFTRSIRASQWLSRWHALRKEADQMPAVETAAPQQPLPVGDPVNPTEVLDRQEPTSAAASHAADPTAGRSEEPLGCTVIRSAYSNPKGGPEFDAP